MPKDLLTFVDSGNSKTDEDIAHDNHASSQIVVTREEARLGWAQDTGDQMDNKVDGDTGSVQGHITSVQRSILGLAQALVVDTSDSAKEGLEDEHDIGCNGI